VWHFCNTVCCDAPGYPARYEPPGCGVKVLPGYDAGTTSGEPAMSQWAMALWTSEGRPKLRHGNGGDIVPHAFYVLSNYDIMPVY